MTTVPNRIVRECAVLDRAQYALLGAAGVQRLMDDVEKRAYEKAAQLGIKRVAVRAKRWSLDVSSGDYPMYLCGPEAPRIETAEDVFTKVWHLDNPRARYEVVLDDLGVIESI